MRDINPYWKRILYVVAAIVVIAVFLFLIHRKF